MLSFNFYNFFKVTKTVLVYVFFFIQAIPVSAEILNQKEIELLSFGNTLFDYFDKKNLHLIKYVPDALEAGFDPSIDLNGETILHRAISSAKNYEGCALWKDYLKALNAIVYSGIDIYAKYSDKTALTLAFDLYLVKKWDENQYTINGLHLAQILEPFLSVGFDPYSYYKKNLSFFDAAASYNFNEVVDLILGENMIEHHEAPFQTWNLSYIRKQISQGKDFSHYGLNVACPNDAYGSLSFLHKNQRKRCQVAIMILLENGFDPCKKQIADQIIETPLHTAAWLGNKEIIDLLIKNGADIEAKNANGFTPLMVATFSRQAESFSCLVHHGADLNIIVPKTNSSLKNYIRDGQFKKFFKDLRLVYRGMETIQLIMY